MVDHTSIGLPLTKRLSIPLVVWGVNPTAGILKSATAVWVIAREQCIESHGCQKQRCKGGGAYPCPGSIHRSDSKDFDRDLFTGTKHKERDAWKHGEDKENTCIRCFVNILRLPLFLNAIEIPSKKGCCVMTLIHPLHHRLHLIISSPHPEH